MMAFLDENRCREAAGDAQRVEAKYQNC